MKEFAIKFLTIIASFLIPIIPMILLVTIMVIIDTFYGRWAAKIGAIREGKNYMLEVTSKKTRLGFTSKILSYYLSILLTYGIDYFILNDIVYSYIPFEYIISKVVTLFLIYIEFKSIEEKIYKIKGVVITEKFISFLKGIKKIFLNITSMKKEL